MLILGLDLILYLFEDVLCFSFAHAPGFADVVEKVDSGFGALHDKDERVHALVPVFQSDDAGMSVNSKRGS